MKIVHSSKTLLGKSFADRGINGDKLRAGIKRSFSKVIDLAIAEKADLVILAGDTFDNVEVSEHLLSHFLSEVERLERIPLAILPGARDAYQKGCFWEEWEAFNPLPNLHLLTRTERPYVELQDASVAVYGYPVLAESSPEHQVIRIKRVAKARNHIGVIYGNMSYGKSPQTGEYSFASDELKSCQMDYIALGGSDEFHDFTPLGLKAAYSGSTEALSPDRENSRNVALVTLDGARLVIEPRIVGSFQWKNIDIPMETVTGIDDLKSKLNELAGPDVLLKATLKGLTLLEAGLDTDELVSQLENNFLQLELVDQTSVLPENISEVKVREKTILGQYLKIMVEKMNTAQGPEKEDLEKSLKAGYTLLTGKEIW